MAATVSSVNPLVQGPGLFWQLSKSKFVSIAFDNVGNRRAGIFDANIFSGWHGTWCVEPNDAVLIEVNVIKMGWHFAFDGRLLFSLSRPHVFQQCRDMIMDGAPEVWHNIHNIVIIDSETAPVDVDITWLPAPTHDTQTTMLSSSS